jgi:hypothetical protein
MKSRSINGWNFNATGGGQRPEQPNAASAESKEDLEATAEVKNDIFTTAVQQLEDTFQDRSHDEMAAFRENLETLVWCSPAGGNKDNTHTSATRHLRLPTPPQHTLTFCAPHAHPLPPTSMAFVSYGFVLVRVRS